MQTPPEGEQAAGKGGQQMQKLGRRVPQRPDRSGDGAAGCRTRRSPVRQGRLHRQAKPLGTGFREFFGSSLGFVDLGIVGLNLAGYGKKNGFYILFLEKSKF
jgi:hypothetical protein